MQRNLEYTYEDPELNGSHDYLLPPIEAEINRLKPQKLFDLGCGNGSVANYFSKHCSVVGADLSKSAIQNAKIAYPHLRLELRSVYDDLAKDFGTFPVVISLEVVEHLYDPRAYAKTLFDLVAPGGTAIVSTPYHGYIKNLAMAVTGQMDHHFHALWDGGHIKFWSVKTLGILLREVGFTAVRFDRVGRVKPLAKSMIALAQKPA
jgi:2-polyprenyl-3-methyl-5-hydroxy-6-metoxy-1,4-benzoquinol methylase